jgi:acyl-CoA reductase-like NAD-dependent aldehyde dehydrogenase
VKLAHLFQEAGLPDGVFNVVIGSNQVGSQICRHSDVGMVSFTGSTCAGRNVAVNCAERLIPYTLELGGNNPVIVCNDADIEKAVAAIVEGAFSNMGQNCCSASRIYIHSSVYDQVVAQIVILTQKLKIGDPMNIETFIGPLATQDHFSKVMQAISTFSETEDILCGGSALGLTVQPTIYANVSEDSQLAQKEIFGPVLAIMKP